MTVTKLTVAQQVIDRLRGSIADGVWKVGDKIPSENQLTRELGVSRASIRLAIQQFIALGVMESHHGKGTFITSTDVRAMGRGIDMVGEKECQDIETVLEFRVIVEPECCRLAAAKGDDACLAELRRLLDGMVSSIGNSEEFVRNDIRFHMAISRASGNPLLEKSLRDVFSATIQDHQRINTLFGFKDGVYYHSLILKAFESRDSKRARKLMAEHLEQALEQLRPTADRSAVADRPETDRRNP
ncbi:MAG: FadR family transcriptional regulator [Planctomycetes bacterium]|nr:FadR family transcriptional regulator [Planctomycetota bacterium]